MEKLIVSASEAREMICIKAEDMSRLLKEGKIKAYRRGSRWCIPVECLKEYIIQQAELESYERRVWND